MEKATHPQPTVLVVDDNIDNCRIFEHILKQVGYQVTIATSGQSGQDILEVQTFTLAIIDLQIPDVIGIEILEGIQHSQVHSQMHIIVATAYPHMVFEDSTQSADFIVHKPIDSDNFGQLVERLKSSYPY